MLFLYRQIVSPGGEYLGVELTQIEEKLNQPALILLEE